MEKIESKLHIFCLEIADDLLVLKNCLQLETKSWKISFSYQ
jgi:hypothetical protein